MNKRSKAVMVLRFAAAFIAFTVVISFVVMSLWNWLIPELFHGPVITYVQALGLLVLSKILFGGFRRGGPHPGWRHGPMRERMRRRLEAKMETMSEEEREKLRRRFERWDEKEGRFRFGGHYHPGKGGQNDQPAEQ